MLPVPLAQVVVDPAAFVEMCRWGSSAAHPWPRPAVALPRAESTPRAIDTNRLSWLALPTHREGQC